MAVIYEGKSFMEQEYFLLLSGRLSVSFFSFSSLTYFLALLFILVYILLFVYVSFRFKKPHLLQSWRRNCNSKATLPNDNTQYLLPVCFLNWIHLNGKFYIFVIQTLDTSLP